MYLNNEDLHKHYGEGEASVSVLNGISLTWTRAR